MDNSNSNSSSIASFIKLGRVRDIHGLFFGIRESVEADQRERLRREEEQAARAKREEEAQQQRQLVAARETRQQRIREKLSGS